jgi:hypothetical protein
MVRRRAGDEPQAAPGEQGATPPYYIATEPLFVGDQFTRAFNPGDRVPPDHVDRYGWADKVRRPDEPHPRPGTPADQPETTEDQATIEEKGDA